MNTGRDALDRSRVSRRPEDKWDRIKGVSFGLFIREFGSGNAVKGVSFGLFFECS